jgi:pyruvate dehydrogenase phosphatase
MLQISRSIGDVYLKKPEFNRTPLHSKFRLRETFKKPILSSEPAITVHQIQPNDQFVIFASDGLWEHLSNQEAVELVQSNPRNVCVLLLHSSSHLLKFLSRLSTLSFR